MKIAFIGFGGVGQALVQMIGDTKHTLLDEVGMAIDIVAVSDMMKGAVYDPNGLDGTLLLDTIAHHKDLMYYPDTAHTVKGMDSFETIKHSNADVIVEVTYTDVVTGQPAIDHCRLAFENGKSVVTTNKGPVAMAYIELKALAERNTLFWGFEGTVMSGTPALRLPFTTLTGNTITEINGILNGTTNYMITKMERGLSYEEALKTAQARGYAEADPTSDVAGYDARYKAVILANVILKHHITAEEVECTGIEDITASMVKEAVSNDKRWRLIATLKRHETGVKASVGPKLLDKDHPLATITGATNAIVYNCDLAGPIMLTGAGAGLTETAYSLLIDLINGYKSVYHQASQKVVHEHADTSTD
ncbi:homoserine dehydrogenase [Salipaludibacillus agaradhaerens]|uniref:Homoserine dehydrogenase n=1 Tax=Salipaludibacillus agaradhaerens TaxID=76935 RepID=A0A9Q4AZR7_SALAG|nr:homoserine dehydrogenase [Salipaludibacillus agaradhaerens]MCR6095380.1 homoserine dehydrogenase [Salipaludibacillus agaradhaerens]MCR6115062.1 homoserine dehydrogenase [Salipaludibacillus agaradhaerens]